MSTSAEDRKSISPGNPLPPVEPPSAGFILQLFVVPGVIVTIIVAVWLMFNWLAQAGSDPRSYVKAIARHDAASWQAAHNLADVLRSDARQGLKQDRVLAGDLIGLLEAELGAGGTSQDSARLQTFLCAALGEFKLPEVVPVLVKAATATGNAISEDAKKNENGVRTSAIEALAVVESNLADAGQSQLDRLLPVLLKATDDEDPVLQTSATFALGVVGGNEALTKLRAIVHGSGPTSRGSEIRYNAAIGLARQGDAEAIPTLQEMLDSDRIVVNVDSQRPANRDDRRALIVMNALRATEQLRAKNPQADIRGLLPAVESLSKTEPVEQVRLKALELMQEIAKP